MRIKSSVQQKLTLRRVVLLSSSFVVILSLGLILFIQVSNSRKAYAAPANGDYRSNGSGNWSTIGIWQKYGGGAWAAAPSAPTSADKVITIQSGNAVTVSVNVTVDQVVVSAGGSLIVNSGITLSVANGGGTDLDVFGTLKNAGTVSFVGGTIMIVENGGTYQHNYTTTPGTIPTATWSVGSNCEIIGYTGNGSAPGGLQSFYNFTWNCPGQTQDISLGGGLSAVSGTLSIINTGSTNNFLRLGTAAVNTTIGGDFNMSGGNFELIKGNAVSTMNITGNFIQSGGVFTVADGNNNSTINLTGNMSHTGGTMTQLGSSVITYVFKKAGTQTYIASGNTVSGSVDYNVNSGSTLDVGTSIVLGRNFTVASGGGIAIGSLLGVTSSGSNGNIQVTGTRSFNALADYTFSGAAAQVTGNGLPATIHNLTINNSSNVTLTSTVAINGTLTFITGNIITGANEVNITNTSTSAIVGYSSSNYIIGNLRRSVIGTGSYDFPIGIALNYELANVTLASATGVSNLLAFFTNSNPELVTLPLTGISVAGITMEHMMTYGFWTITPNLPIITGTATVSCTEIGNSLSNSSGCTYSLLNRLTSLLPWISLGTHNNNTQTVIGSAVTAVRSVLNVFGDFAIAYGELLSFSSPTLTSGVAGQVNAIYVFPNVCSNVDAWIQIMSLDGGATLNSIDNYSAGNGYSEAFQPYINAPPNTTSSILWDIKFKIAGTATDTVLPSLAITGVDIDAGSNIQEFVEATYPYSYGLAAGTALTVTNYSGSYRAVASNALGSIANIDTAQHQAMYQINYKNINHFLYRTGVISTNNAMQTRQTSLYFKSFFPNNIALPIKLVYFDGKLKNNKVKLSWTTESEENNSFFTVERSDDGENFKAILSQLGAGNSTRTLYYSAVDDEPLSGLSFYRLKQTDYDGHSSYSDVRTIKNGNENITNGLEIKTIGPNPFRENLDLNFINKSGEAVDVCIFNSAGQVFSRDVINPKEGNNNYQFQKLSDLNPGIYFITLTCGEQNITKRVVKE